MVLNIGRLKEGAFDEVFRDIASVAAVCKGAADEPVPLKVILETTMLTTEEIVDACIISDLAGATFVKTSTGFGGGGATVSRFFCCVFVFL